MPMASDAARQLAERSAQVRRSNAWTRKINDLADAWPTLTTEQIARIRALLDGSAK